MVSVARTKRRARVWIQENIPYIVVISMITTLLVVFLWPRIFITINGGEAGVLYKRFTIGTVTDYVYPEGLHIIFPWDIMHIYDARVQLVKHQFKVLTNQGLPVYLKIAIRFHPEYELIGVLHQKIGPDYVNKIIIPQIESVMRRNIGKYTPEDIYTNKEGVLSNIIVLALEETGRKYVRISDIIIRSLDLPEPVAKSIEDKLVYEEQYKSYIYILEREKQEADRKRIEAEGIKDYQRIIAETLDDKMLTWQGIKATAELSESENAKVLIFGNQGTNGLPLILGAPLK
ncbi:prohibitin family protein [Candidatus Albibeggiatoa sp. nov. BB20]|uniref:prohibitin family protein n=1 Tax=Candidatus Albibeggiatoa sp. nov. BB20 TaxID=3162723 RepID=UPI003365890D